MHQSRQRGYYHGKCDMKINIEAELTPEELRRFMGLPDVSEWQKMALDNFAESLSASQAQQEEFAKGLLTSGINTWQSLFTPFANPTGNTPASGKN